MGQAVTIKTPRWFDLSSARKEWFQLWLDHRDEPVLAIDLRPLKWIEPAGIAVLASCCAWRLNKNLKTMFIRPNEVSGPVQYLQRMNFFRTFGTELKEGFERHADDKRFLTLCPITTKAVAKDLSTELRGMIDQRMGESFTSIARAAEGVFDELGANIVDHSSSELTGFAVAQVFHDKGLLKIALCDAGIGVSASLSKNFELTRAFDTDADALRLAVKGGVSGNGAPGGDGRYVNSGLGLLQLTRIADDLKGSARIHSGNAYLTRQNSETKVNKSPVWNGVLATFEIPVPSGPAAQFDFTDDH